MVKTAALSGKGGGQHSSLLKAMSALTRMGSSKYPSQKHDDRCQLAGLIIAQGLTRVSCHIMATYINETNEYPSTSSPILAARPTSHTILMPDPRIDIIFSGNKCQHRSSASSRFPIFLPRIGPLRKVIALIMVALRARETWRWQEKPAVPLSLRYGKQWQRPSSPRISLRERITPTTLSRSPSRVLTGTKSRWSRRRVRKGFWTCQTMCSFGLCKPKLYRPRVVVADRPIVKVRETGLSPRHTDYSHYGQRS